MERNAAEQLAAIADARSAVADRLTTPWWYHPTLGVLCAGTGIWVSGFASRWATALGALVGVVALAGWATVAYTDPRWPVWALAVAGFTGTVVLGRRFDTALRAQLRAAG